MYAPVKKLHSLKVEVGTWAEVKVLSRPPTRSVASSQECMLYLYKAKKLKLIKC